MDINNCYLNRLKSLSLALGTGLAFCVSSGNLAKADDAYGRGLELFNQGYYERSLDYLKRAEIVFPSDPAIHYYLASAYSRLGKHNEAKQEYFASYCLDPASKTGEYCRAALRTYGEPVPGDVAGVTPTSDVQVERAVSQIKRQAAHQKQSNNDVANQASLTAGRVGEEEASRIKNAAYRRLNSRPAYLVPGQFFNQDTDDPNLVMSRAEEGARLAKLSAKQKADEYEKWSKDQEKSVDEIAGNLESQLKTSKVKGGAKLRPEGTGFYVRFYGQERNGPLPDNHPSVARFEPFSPSDSTVHGDKPGGQ